MQETVFTRRRQEEAPGRWEMRKQSLRPRVCVRLSGVCVCVVSVTNKGRLVFARVEFVFCFNYRLLALCLPHLM